MDVPFCLEGTPINTWCCIFGTHHIDPGSFIHYHVCNLHGQVYGLLIVPQLLKVPEIANLLLPPPFVSIVESIQSKEEEDYENRTDGSISCNADICSTTEPQTVLEEDENDDEVEENIQPWLRIPYKDAEELLNTIARIKFPLTESQMDYVKSIDIHSINTLATLLKWIEEAHRKGLMEYKSASSYRRKANYKDEYDKCVFCITLVKVGQMLRVFPCSHHFHSSCADNWLKENVTCPLCRNLCLPLLE